MVNVYLFFNFLTLKIFRIFSLKKYIELKKQLEIDNEEYKQQNEELIEKQSFIETKLNKCELERKEYFNNFERTNQQVSLFIVCS